MSKQEISHRIGSHHSTHTRSCSAQFICSVRVLAFSFVSLVSFVVSCLHFCLASILGDDDDFEITGESKSDTFSPAIRPGRRATASMQLARWQRLSCPNRDEILVQDDRVTLETNGLFIHEIIVDFVITMCNSHPSFPFSSPIPITREVESLIQKSGVVSSSSSSSFSPDTVSATVVSCISSSSTSTEVVSSSSPQCSATASSCAAADTSVSNSKSGKLSHSHCSHHLFERMFLLMLMLLQYLS